jgi:hypothetical protein
LEIPLGPSVIGAPDNPGVANALAVQGASDITLGGATISANNPSPVGGVLASSDIPRALSNVVNGGGQNSISGNLQNGFDRTAQGNEALLREVQALIKLNQSIDGRLQTLVNSSSLTNDVLRVQARGTTKI